MSNRRKQTPESITSNAGYVTGRPCTRPAGGHVVIYDREDGFEIDAEHRWIVMHEPSSRHVAVRTRAIARDTMKHVAGDGSPLTVDVLPPGGSEENEAPPEEQEAPSTEFAAILTGRKRTDKNKEILSERVGRRLDLSGPLVGDLLILPGGEVSRIARHRHGHVQPANYSISGGGSIHLTSEGHGSYSGALDRSKPASRIQATGKRGPSDFWIFDEGTAGAGRSVEVRISVPIWFLAPEGDPEAPVPPEALEKAGY